MKVKGCVILAVTAARTFAAILFDEDFLPPLCSFLLLGVTVGPVGSAFTLVRAIQNLSTAQWGVTYFTLHYISWAHSIIWLMRPTHNRGSLGSNPSGPTIYSVISVMITDINGQHCPVLHCKSYVKRPAHNGQVRGSNP
jgi:hypothetical protein